MSVAVSEASVIVDAKYVTITLTWSECLLASQIGMLRQIESLKKGLPDKHGFDGLGWDVHIEGAMGELAVAKYLGVYWSGSVNTFKNLPDVDSLEIRTRSKPEYELIVRENDSDDSVFVLVTGKCPKYTLVGCIPGAQAKSPQWRKTHGGRPPAYFVPHSALLPVAEIIIPPGVL